MISTALLYFNVIRILFMGEADVLFWRVQSWSSLFLWFSFCLFLKSFDQYSYLVRMIQEVVKDAMPFVVIFIIGVLAFADSFSSLSELLAL